MKKKQITPVPQVPQTVTRPELLIRNSDLEFRDLINNLLAFAGLLESIRSGFADYIGLSGIQYTILICIAHLDESNGVGVKDIAKHLTLSGAFITIETGKLEKQKLVTKLKNPADKRSVLLKVTHRGNTLLNKLAPIQQKVNDALFNSLSKNDFIFLNKLIIDMVNDAQMASAMLKYLSVNSAHKSTMMNETKTETSS